MLSTFAVVAAPGDVAKELTQRYGDVVDRLSFYAPYRNDPAQWRAVIADLKSA
jgi:hypothetical protein